MKSFFTARRFSRLLPLTWKRLLKKPCIKITPPNKSSEVLYCHYAEMLKKKKSKKILVGQKTCYCCHIFVFPYYTNKEQKVLNARLQRIKFATLYTALRMKILEETSIHVQGNWWTGEKKLLLKLWRHTQQKKIKHLPTKPRDDLQWFQSYKIVQFVL